MKHFGGYLPCFLNLEACVADTTFQRQVGWHIPEENMGEVAAMYCPIGDGSSIERMTEACRGIMRSLSQLNSFPEAPRLFCLNCRL